LQLPTETAAQGQLDPRCCGEINWTMVSAYLCIGPPGKKCAGICVDGETKQILRAAILGVGGDEVTASLSFARTDASQFDQFLPPRPTTSRPREIPAGNIKQHKTDSSLHISLSKSLRGCGADVSGELSQQATTASSASSAGTWTQICEENDYAPATTTAS